MFYLNYIKTSLFVKNQYLSYFHLSLIFPNSVGHPSLILSKLLCGMMGLATGSLFLGASSLNGIYYFL